MLKLPITECSYRTDSQHPKGHLRISTYPESPSMVFFLENFVISIPVVQCRFYMIPQEIS